MSDMQAAMLEDAKTKLRMIRDEPRFELLLPSEADEVLRALDAACSTEDVIRRTLRAINDNALAWHAGEDGKAKALNVIAVWTSEALAGRLHPGAEAVTEENFVTREERNESTQYEWKFEGPCPNCGHDDSRHEWGGGGYSNVSIMYCEVEGCDCSYWDGQDKPDDPLGWTGGKSGVTL